jgi:tRNA(Ile)-lysidine synthase
MPRGSHPPTLLTLVRRALSLECGLSRGSKVLLAVSGGGDSMALLDVLAKLRQKLGFELVAAGVDHGLREGAALELELARAHAARLGVGFLTLQAEVEAGSNLQARARDARYRILYAVQAEQEADLLATAHHANDRAETVLLRLLRGAGPRGLAVLPPRHGQLIRPMIRATKADVLLHLARHKVPFAEDPSNQQRRFLRVRVRKELLPLLVDLSPGIVEHLTALSDQLLASGVERPAWGVEPGLVLGRRQLALLERASKRGLSSTSLRVQGGRELSVELGPRGGGQLGGRAGKPKLV